MLDGSGTATTVVFLHGLGDEPASWNSQIETLPDGFDGIALTIPGLDDDQRFSLSAAADHVAAEMDRRGLSSAHLCGLSLGAMIAVQFARERPGRVRSLIIAAGQVRPRHLTMALQNVALRLMPAKTFGGASMKRRLLAVLREASRADFTSALASIHVPALILCGAEDRLNLAAAEEFATGITDARLVLLDNAGHQCNRDQPERFSEVLNGFLTDRSDITPAP